MRFCTECGNSLQAAPAAAPAQPAPAQPAPRAAAPQSTASPGGPAVAQQISGAIGGPLCWRCRGVGDQGSDFCKFCGARYADAPGGSAAAAPAAAPAQRAQPAAANPQPAARAQPAQHAHGHAAPAAAARAGTATARLVSILKDGTDGQAFALDGEEMDIGRVEGSIVLPDDPYLSRRHARVKHSAGRYTIRDLDSENGVFVRLTGPVEVQSGDHILIGQQVLRFELLPDAELPLGPASIRGVLVFGTPEVPRYGRLVQYTTEGIGRDHYYLFRDETILGRENGDIVFTDDPFLSRRHASIRVERATKRCTLADVGSSNGTSIRIRGEHALQNGDHFRVGRHLFRFDAGGA